MSDAKDDIFFDVEDSVTTIEGKSNIGFLDARANEASMEALNTRALEASKKTVHTSGSADDLDATNSVPHQQQLQTFMVYIVTWNVGTRFPDNISLKNLLQIHSKHDQSPEKQQLPDIYAIGLQEVNAQPQNQVLGLFKEDPWTNKVKDVLKNHDYVIIKTEQMQGLLLTLFVKRDHVQHLRDIEAEFTRTGFGGIWGNKGAVSIRFNIYGCAITFVVAHLAAHDHHLDERIEDYKQILEHHHYHVKRYREIFDHDYVFWFGDLNFRLQGEDTPEDVHAAVQDEKLSDLLQRDQLNHVRERTREAFHYLQERLPGFPPTFKFKESTSTYDLKRRPAWTDRILYAVQPLDMQPKLPLEIKQLSYKSHPGYNISDHQPVTSEFEIQLFKNYRATCVKFSDIPIWNIGKEITVEYTKPLEFEEKDHDWIGIYPCNFSSLSDYAGYEYVNQAETPPAVESDDFQPSSSHRHRHHNRQRLRRHVHDNIETVRIDFSEDIELKIGQNYLLIYFQNTGLRGVTSVAGMSNAFRADKRPPSPRTVSED